MRSSRLRLALHLTSYVLYGTAAFVLAILVGIWLLKSLQIDIPVRIPLEALEPLTIIASAVASYAAGLAAKWAAVQISDQDNPSLRDRPQETLDPHLRARLLSNLAARVHQRLEDTLDRQARIALGLQTVPSATMAAWQLHFSGPAPRPSDIPTNTPIIDVFDRSGGQLLVLGAPGAGKTTLLLELARDLITRAQQDGTHSIPVIVNLSSWGIKAQSVDQWLEKVLPDAAGISPALARQLITGDDLLLLFDGLDEVAESRQAACIEAINAFCREREPLQLAVCSRSDEYQATGIKLQLASAIRINPLTFPQVEEVLRVGGNKTAGICAALRNDQWLCELLVTPLMLNVTILAYAGQPVRAIRARTLEERRMHLFDSYVRRMFQQRRLDPSYSRATFLHWLVWLANGMSRHGLTEFLIERLQPTWLSTGSSYHLVTRLGTGLVFGLVSGLVIGLAEGLVSGLVSVLIFGLFSGQVSKLDPRSAIRPAEQLSWSWSRVRPDLRVVGRFSLVSALVFGLYSGLIGGLLTGLVAGLLTGLVMGAASGLLFGLRSAQLETTTTPNQGMWHSFQNALISGLILGLTLGVVLGVVLRLEVGLVAGLFFGLFIWLVVGGAACIQHLILRLLLTRSGKAPWNYVRFLNAACDLLFLQHVGGGYRFRHGLLQEYFAALTPDRIHDLARDPE